MSEKKEDLKSELKSIAIFIMLALAFRASIVQAYKIPSASMEDTLQIGDHIFVNKISYGFRLPFMEKALFRYDAPKREDIVVFTLPEDPSIDIIKRVMAVPGDEVEVRGTKLFINGTEYDDSRYAIWREGGLKDFGPMKVPEGRVLLLGDNRDHSRDSRFWNDHFLEMDRIVGRAFVIWWNWSNPTGRMFRVIR